MGNWGEITCKSGVITPFITGDGTNLERQVGGFKPRLKNYAQVKLDQFLGVRYLKYLKAPCIYS